MMIGGTTLTRDQEAEFKQLIEVLQAGLGDQGTATSDTEEVWLLYHTVEYQGYVEMQSKDETP